MSEDAPVLLAIADRVARLTLHRPHRLNAFDGAMHGALREALARIEADESLRAVIVTGAGKAFCAGQDLAERAAQLETGAVDLEASLEANYNPLVRRLAALPIPSIALVNGVAAGAGASLAIACDIVIAARSARFQFPFARLGLGPDSGASWQLPRLVGPAKARGLLLTGEAIDAETAERWGLIWRVVADESLSDEGERLAAAFASGSREALAAAKRLLAGAATASLDAALDAEREEQGVRGRHPDYREAVAAFIAKRSPRFG